MPTIFKYDLINFDRSDPGCLTTQQIPDSFYSKYSLDLVVRCNLLFDSFFNDVLVLGSGSGRGSSITACIGHKLADLLRGSSTYTIHHLFVSAIDGKMEALAKTSNLTPTSKVFAEKLDLDDSLKEFRNEFLFPAESEDSSTPATYLCGNSLGIQPKKTREHIINQLDKWGREGVEGHFTDPTPWLTIDDIVMESMARLVGALPSEIVMMNSLTVNLHLMMVSFYRPTAVRHKILIEKKAFPSDVHAVVSQILHHKLDPSVSLIEIGPRDGEVLLRIEDIEAVIAAEGESIALVLFSGVQYYTGQLFDMGRISTAAKSKGCKVGFDLAHAVGNVPLKLHDWGCDFACWCSYKYMNCGPGSIGGCFVHDSHSKKETELIEAPADAAVTTDSAPHFQQVVVDPPRFSGWWGHRLDDRFLMAPQFIPCEGAYGYRLSNPPVLLIAGARASLDLFDKAGMDRLRKKSVLLTSYLEYLLNTVIGPEKVEIFTPSDPEQRGCQLSITFQNGIESEAVNKLLLASGVICDVRKPNVMRVAPAPLYNSFMDVYNFIQLLEASLLTLSNTSA